MRFLIFVCVILLSICLTLRVVTNELLDVQVEDRHFLPDIRTQFIPDKLKTKKFQRTGHKHTESQSKLKPILDLKNIPDLIVYRQEAKDLKTLDLHKNSGAGENNNYEVDGPVPGADRYVDDIKNNMITSRLEHKKQSKFHNKKVSSKSHYHRYRKTEADIIDEVRLEQSRRMQSYMDTTANPCKNFYQYACGNWIRTHSFPYHETGLDTFEILRDSLDIELKNLLEEPVSKLPAGFSRDAIEKTKIYYRSCINEGAIEKRGAEPLLKLLNDLGGWPVLDPEWDQTNFNWIEAIARIRKFGCDVLLTEWVSPDFTDTTRQIIQFDQTTLGLPSRNHFLDSSKASYLRSYKAFICKIIELLGGDADDAANAAEEIVSFEVQLAKITISSDDRPPVSELYKKRTVAQLHQEFPHIDWMQYLTLVSLKIISPNEQCVLFAHEYMTDLALLIEDTSSRTLANYIFWRLVRQSISHLDSRFKNAKEQFHYGLFGKNDPLPRWKECVAQINENLGMAIGSLFVQRYFDEQSKNDTIQMTREIRQSFRELLRGAPWIDESTKFLSLEKLDEMIAKIGYPNTILNRKALNKRYNDLDFTPTRFFENNLRVLAFETLSEHNKLGVPVNRAIWSTPPVVVNAFYSRNKNQIMFPAGILRPPFYHRYFPKCLNYGGIGVVIGHEIIHGFDDKGRLFDKHGNMRQWWKRTTTLEFHKRVQCLIDQYGQYYVGEVQKLVDGITTQDENIADNGGLKEAFKAYKMWLKKNDDKEENLPGFNASNEQLFFLNFAQVWCADLSAAVIISKLENAVHPPGKYRVIGTVSNSKEFAAAFNCRVGEPMNPRKKCIVW